MWSLADHAIDTGTLVPVIASPVEDITTGAVTPGATVSTVTGTLATGPSPRAFVARTN